MAFLLLGWHYRPREFAVSAAILPACAGEEHQGWIRISEDLRGRIENESFVRIASNGQTLFCQVRGTPGETGIVRISEHYRVRLGWRGNLPAGPVELRVKELRSASRLRVHLTHPDAPVRAAFGLGLASVAFGIFSVIATSAAIADFYASQNQGLIQAYAELARTLAVPLFAVSFVLLTAGLSAVFR